MRKKNEKNAKVNLRYIISNDIESKIRRSIDMAEEKVRKTQLFKNSTAKYNLLG